MNPAPGGPLPHDHHTPGGHPTESPRRALRAPWLAMPRTARSRWDWVCEPASRRCVPSMGWAHTDTLIPPETVRSGDSSAGDNSPPHPGQDLCGSDEGTEGGRDRRLVSIQGGSSLQACPGPGVGAHVFSGDCPQYGGCESGRAWARFKQKLKNTPFPRRWCTFPLSGR